MRVESLALVGEAYAALRRRAGLAPYRGRAQARPGRSGPATFKFGGVLYTVWLVTPRGASPAPAAAR
jgi:hypothetical protein